MHEELRTFRQGLGVAPPGAEARARQRLQAAIRCEVADPQPRPRVRRRELVVASAALGAVLAVVSAATFVPRPAGDVAHEADAVAGRGTALPRRHLSERGLRLVRTPRTGEADGALAAFPSLDGRDAGFRPPYERGGWSECATSGCYSEL